jgi:hypothetical protein
MWLPAGSTVRRNNSAQYADVIREYFGTVAAGRDLKIGS